MTMSEPADMGEARVLTEGLAHFWHPVEYSANVTDRPVAVKLLERPLALWRSNGGLVAFHDLCVHRGTPLSLGSVCHDEIVCAYHGWHYRSDGACTRIPSLLSTRPIPTRARATAYRADERYGLVWVCLDKPRAAIPPFPPESEDPTFSWAENYLTREAARVKANAARFVENMMDVAHFPWVHEGILGTRDDAEIADVAIETTATGFEYEVESNFSGSMMMDRDRPIRRPTRSLCRSR
jgi:phenylpropionate dioxygenase-like ring-hydroxylating dioxygenase large terminal subunit